jgi:hypothetical protein
MILMRVIFMIIVIFCMLAAGCASQGISSKTKMSSKYHKKEYPRSQANINSLTYSSNRKKNNKPGFFKRIFPGKKSYFAGN